MIRRRLRAYAALPFVLIGSFLVWCAVKIDGSADYWEGI